MAAAPREEDFGDLVVGDRSGQARGLLDEFFAFRRPLTLDEVQRLWQLPAVNRHGLGGCGRWGLVWMATRRGYVPRSPSLARWATVPLRTCGS